MAVATRPPDTLNLPTPGVENFDMETCFTRYKNACVDAETPFYQMISYLFVCFLFIAFLLNLSVILLYLQGIREFKKVWITFS